MLLSLLQQQDMSGTGESLLDNGTKHISEFVLFNFRRHALLGVRKKQQSPDKSPIDIDEMIELIQRLSKWSAYYKASTILQKTRASSACSGSKVDQVPKGVREPHQTFPSTRL
jgi:hypothetical protein